jgi:hypothetical protein
MGMFDKDGDARILEPVLFLFKGPLLDLLRVGVVKDIVDQLEPCIGYAFRVQTKRKH